VKVYTRAKNAYIGWCSNAHRNPKDDNTIREYEALMMSKYKPNTLTARFVALNWWLQYVGMKDIRFRIPKTTVPENPRLIAPDEYARLLKAVSASGDLKLEVLVRLCHDSAWRPSDVGLIEPRHVNMAEGFIEKRSLKTRFTARAYLHPDTIPLLEAYLSGEAPAHYLFETRTGKPADRYWVEKEIHRAGKMADMGDLTPRVFRRTFATTNQCDTADALIQGGWSDSRTYFRTYRRSVPERHKAGVMRTWGVQDEDEPPGYG